jgi:hypothetical protein
MCRVQDAGAALTEHTDCDRQRDMVPILVEVRKSTGKCIAKGGRRNWRWPVLPAKPKKQ